MKISNNQKRLISFCLLLLFIGQLVHPTAALALTGGPSQPEVESFEPVGTNQMVDLFTGDFNYNIPLLNVPGPGGGYPINLSYHAGIGMDQEASWVGLGWNINAGVINRQVRGLPDDFNGQEIEQQLNMKPEWNVGINLSQSAVYEIFGANAGLYGGSVSGGVYYNSYRGVGIRGGVSISTNNNNWGLKKQLSTSLDGDLSLGFSFDSQSGIGISTQASWALSENTESKREEFKDSKITKQRVVGIGVSLQSSNGKKQLGVGLDVNTFRRSSEKYRWKYGQWRDTSNSSSASASCGISFSGSAYVPGISFSMNSWGFGFSGVFGPETGGLQGPTLGVDGNFSHQSIDNNNRNAKAYGYLYEHNVDDQSEKYTVMDFNRDGGQVVSKHVPAIPPAIHTHDIYLIKGQGVGGIFRPFRSDIAFLKSGQVKSYHTGVDPGIEVGYTATPTPSAKIAYDGTATFGVDYSGPWMSANDDENSIVGLGNSSLDEFGLDEVYTKRDNRDADMGPDPLFEPAFFGMYGEQVGMKQEEIENLKPFSAERFEIKRKWTGISAKPTAENTLEHQQHFVKERRNRNQFQGYTTAFEMIKSNAYSPMIQIGTGVSVTNVSVKDHVEDVLTSDQNLSSVAAMYVVNSEGMRYNYGLPVYNLKETEVVFSVERAQNNDSHYQQPYVEYSSEDLSVNNYKGFDHYFSRKDIPEYAHSYLLTEVTSPDYVDLTGDGPSEDDFGTYVKFNYVLANQKYGWRSPYAFGKCYIADYMPGYYSHDKDDKASVSYGEKEIYYLQSIETKTHIANFILNDDGPVSYDSHGNFQNGTRLDGMGVTNIHQDPSLASLSTKLKYLVRIELYEKNSASLPVLQKSVHFSYSYELCPDVENNDNVRSHSCDMPDSEYNNLIGGLSRTAVANTGKLTLKKTWVTYKNNLKGELNSYGFDYTNNVEYSEFQNPQFNPYHYDRWGNFLIDDPSYSGVESREHPYVRQSLDYDGNGNIDNDNDVDKRNYHSSAWNLRKIHLPSGGEINIDYESDDYAYVQNLPAMEMLKIVGMSDGIVSSEADFLGKGDLTGSGNNVKNRIYFDISDVTSEDLTSYVEKCFSDQDYLYFKVFMRLKKKEFSLSNTSDDAIDYVDGWAKIKRNGSNEKIIGWENFGDKNYGWVEVDLVNFKGEADGNERTHPFRMAGWQYLQGERRDLLFQEIDNNEAFSDLFVTVFSSIRETIPMLLGFYRSAKLKGFCNKINYSRPSFIRMNCADGVKYGGGNRVKKITIKDNWSEIVSGENDGEYGQEYFYKLSDGKTSSGVAEYEPIIGGEENPFRQPIPYNGNENVFSWRNDQTYMEGPMCESYFPGASVGYSRVIVKQFRNDNNSFRNSEGIQVSEFYTSKDFPIKIKQTDLDYAPYNVPIPIPFVGSQRFFNNGYSQGYAVILNDMSGKPKSEKTFPYLGQDLSLGTEHNNFFANINPASSIEYLYKTRTPYNEEANNELFNLVEVLTSDGVVENKYLGISTELTMHQEQNSNWLLNAGVGANLDLIVPLTVTTYYPIINYSESMYRAISTVKVTAQSGILEKIVTVNDGNTSVMTNLLWDDATGKPLLTSINNNYNDPVYSYSYPSHWYYNTMRGSYINEGAKFYVNHHDDHWGGNSTSQPGITNPTSGILEFHPDMFRSGANVADYFEKGDMLQLFPSGAYFWVIDDHVGDLKISILNEDNEPPSGLAFLEDSYFKIVKSAYKNQQNSINGAITTLSNPVQTETFLDLLNELLSSTTPIVIGDVLPQIVSPCGIIFNVSIVGAANGQIEIHISGTGLDGNDLIGKLELSDPEDVERTIPLPSLTDFANSIFSFDDDGHIILDLDDGEVGEMDLSAKFSGNFDLENPCPLTVLHASAITYTDDWSGRIKLNEALNPSGLLDSDLLANPLRYGVVGTWRPDATYVYQVDRKQLNLSGVKSRTNSVKDGLYDVFHKFNWLAPLTNGPNYWTEVAHVNYYSPYGFALEDENALGIRSSALFGFSNDLPIASASNADNKEIAFESFEEYSSGLYPLGGGEFNFGHFPLMSEENSTAILDSRAHTGKKSLRIPPDTYYSVDFTTNPNGEFSNVNLGASHTNTFQSHYFIPKCNTDGSSKKYILSGWFKCALPISPSVTISFETSTSVPVGNNYDVEFTSDESNITQAPVEGWRKFEFVFEGPPQMWSGNMKINFHIHNNQSIPYCLWDDIRLQPFNSEMTTNVYDPITLRMEAQLDARNYATYYQYDEEGALIQVKKETARGVYTIQTHRNNLKSNN